MRYLAEEENDENYIMRSRRMAIDYCRFYIRIVGTCHESFKNKKKCILRNLLKIRILLICGVDIQLIHYRYNKKIFSEIDRKKNVMA